MKKNLNKTKMANMSQNWLEVLVPFSHEYNKKLTGSEISRIVKIPQRSVLRYLEKLVKINLLRVEIRGRNKFYYFDLNNKKSKLILNMIENYKSVIFSFKTSLWVYLEKLCEFGTFVLFGSHVKGYATKDSDIDIVIFARKTQKIKQVLEEMPVQVHFIDLKEFEKILFSGKVLAREIVKSHVVFGDVSSFTNICWRFYKNG